MPIKAEGSCCAAVQNMGHFSAQVKGLLHRHIDPLPRLLAMGVAGIPDGEHAWRPPVAVWRVIEPVGQSAAIAAEKRTVSWELSGVGLSVCQDGDFNATVDGVADVFRVCQAGFPEPGHNKAVFGKVEDFGQIGQYRLRASVR